jgi:hypothetical protein
MALSDSEWLSRLLRQWQYDILLRRTWNALYDSLQPRRDPVPQYRAAYERILMMARTPWARLVVDLTEERLKVQGFQFGEEEEQNDLLWELFRANSMEAMQSVVHREAVTTGTSYVSVWPSEGDPDTPNIRAESSLNVTHENQSGDPQVVAAALKVWLDTASGEARANMYFPDRIVRYATQVTTSEIATIDMYSEAFAMRGGWEPITEVGHNYGTVPMVPFTTRPDYRGYGRSDLRDIAEIIARIEYLTSNTMLAVELGALRQKWATGLEIPTDPDGNEVEPFKVALDRLWISEDPDSKFGAFPATDITPYLKAISDAIGQLSAVSRIPPTYFVQTDLANPPSAASLEASETGLINKINERQVGYGESWETVARLVMKVAKVEAPTDALATLNVLWKDARTRSDSQIMDAAAKMQAVGVPWEAIMEFIGFTPEEISRMESQRAADVFQKLMQGAIVGQAPPGLSTPSPLGSPGQTGGAPNPPVSNGG